MLRRAIHCLAAAAVGLVSPAATSAAAPADLDRTFGNRGIEDFSVYGPATSIIALRDGRYLATRAGSVRNGPAVGSLFALRPSGAADRSFGLDGFADFADGGLRPATAYGVLRQPAAKFVVWGANPPGAPALRLVRYTRDGKVDTTFGQDGRVEVDRGELGRVVARPDGSLVGTLLACDFDHPQEPDPRLPCKVALFALTRDGAVDRSFGTNGAVPHILGNGSFPPEAAVLIASALAADRHGRVVIATGSRPPSGYVSVYRYNANGTRDTSFGHDTGTLLIGPNLDESPADMVVAPDGKIVLLTNGKHGATVTRLTRNGARDRSFGSRGRISVGNVRLMALALQRNGKLVAAGTDPSRTAFALFRFTADGRLDMGFGQRGRVFTDASSGESVDHVVRAVAVDRRGRIVLAGGLGFPDLAAVLVRYRGGASASPRLPRYTVHIRGGGKRLVVGDTVRVGLDDRLHRGQRFALCGLPDRSRCVQGLRTGAHRAVAVSLRKDGAVELRFRIESTGQVIFRTLHVRSR